jgi:hypothetical protein
VRRVLSVFFLTACLSAQDANPPQPADPSQWEFRRKLTVKTPGVVHFIRLDAATLAHSQPSLGDIRVMYEGVSLPYAIETLNGRVDEQALSPALSDKVHTPAGALQFRLRLPAGTRHSRLKIITTDHDFRRPVHIESSDDGKTWDVALDRGYIMKHEQDGQRWEALEVNYPPTTRPFLRVTISDWPDPATFVNATLLLRKELPALLQPVREIVPTTDPSPNPGEQLLRADFGDRPAPWSRLRIETTAPAFYRAARVDTSNDGKLWTPIASGILSRIAETSSLTIDAGEHRARYVRIHIYNRDDQPLPVNKLIFETTARMIKFIPREPGEHSLWYGNPRAKGVTYDLSVILDRDAPIERITLVPGPERRYGAFADTIKPWTEKHPSVLYAAVLAIAALIAAYTLRLMKRIAAQRSGSEPRP